MKIELKDLAKPLEINLIDHEGQILKEYPDPEQDEKVYVAGDPDKTYKIQFKNPNEALRGGGKQVFVLALADGIPVFGKNANPDAEIAARNLTSLVRDMPETVTFETTGWQLNGKELGEFRFVDKKDFSYLEEIGQVVKPNLQTLKFQIFLLDEMTDQEEPDFEAVIYYESKQKLIDREIMSAVAEGEKSPKEYVAELIGAPQPRKKKNIYALVVAINEYPLPHHKLRGCVNDATAMIEFLTSRCRTSDTEVHIKHLLDEDATRQNIIDGFMGHLTQAKPDDVTVFYYCGHGAQEPCPVEFKYLEPDGLNQSIVCVDSRDPFNPNGRDLADKELGYLVGHVSNSTNSHMVVIMDCCHSGGGTRAVGGDTPIKTRQIEVNNKPRALDTFIFYNDPNFESWRFGNEIRIPKGKHTLLGSARGSQTAKETVFDGKQHGAFTFALTQVLQEAKDALSYQEIINRVEAKVIDRVPDQNPQLEIILKEGETDAGLEMNKSFLGGAVLPKPDYYTISYSQKQKSWLMNAGGVNGLPKRTPEPITLAIFDKNENEFKFENAKCKAKIESVGTQESKIVFEGFTADENEQYRAKIMFIPITPVKFFLDGDSAGVEAIMEAYPKYKESRMKDHSSELMIQIVKDQSEAEYRVLAIKGEGSKKDRYIITKLGDDRPMVKSRQGFGEATANEMFGDLSVVANWVRRKEIKNPDTKFADSAVEIKVVECDEDWNDKGEITQKPVTRLEYKNDKAPLARIMIKNNTQQALFCSLLFFDVRFGIDNSAIQMVKLPPNSEEPFPAYNGDVQEFGLEDAFFNNGIFEKMETYKVIYSTVEFSTNDYNQSPLELPEDPTQELSSRPAPAKRPDQVDWSTAELHILTVRPPEVKKVTPNTSLYGGRITEDGGLKASIRMSTEVQAALDKGKALTPSALQGAGMSAVTFAQGSANSEGLSVLEFDGGGSDMTFQKPMQIQLDAETNPNDAIISIGIDEDGICFPLGVATRGADGKSTVSVGDLLHADEQGTRSLGGAMKVMMQKLSSEAMGNHFDAYPILAVCDVSKDGQELKMRGKNQTQCMEEVKKEVAKAKKVIMFVHGIIGDNNDAPKAVELGKYNDNGTMRSISELYDVVLAFDYESLNTEIEINAEKMKERLLAAGFSKDDGKTLHIVAHSMGGLVSRHFIENLAGDDLVDHLIMLGTPNGGSPWAKIKDMVVTFLTIILSKVSLAAWAVAPLTYMIKRGLGDEIKALKQMNPNHPFYQVLNRTDAKPRIPYTIIAGNTEAIRTDPTAKAKMQKIIEKVADAKDSVLNGMIFGSPNDVAVSLSAIKIENIWKERGQDVHIEEVPCDHMSYFNDPNSLAALARLLYERVNKA